MNDRKSGKLERVPQTSQSMTRTTSALSFDIDGDGKDEETGGATQVSVSQQSSKGSTFSRLSRRFFLTKAEGTSSSESAASRDTSLDTSPKRISRNLNVTHAASGAATSKSSEQRKSRQLFLPKSLSMLRISSKLGEAQDQGNNDVEVEVMRKAQEARSDEEDGNSEFASITKAAPDSGRSYSDARTGYSDARADDSSERGLASPKRISSRLFSPKRVDSALPPRLPDHIDATLFEGLSKVIAERDLRDTLVETLIAEHVDGGSIKVRFVSAVNEWDRASTKNDRQNKGRVILSTFLQRDATFPIPGIPRDQLAAITVDTLPLMKTRIMIELLENSVVLQFVKSTFQEERVSEDRRQEE